MSKISTVNTSRNLTINSGSAWARGPPAASPSSANNPSPQSVIGQNNQAAATQAPAAGPASGSTVATPRINGQGSHSRRPSAAIQSSTAGGGPYQASPTTLKESVAVSKSVGEYSFLLCGFSAVLYCERFFFSLSGTALAPRRRKSFGVGQCWEHIAHFSGFPL